LKQVQYVERKMYLADIRLSKLHPALLCAWPTNLGTFASFCFVQLSENHKACGRISEVCVRSRYLLSLQI
jgi:hypothetical protein